MVVDLVVVMVVVMLVDMVDNIDMMEVNKKTCQFKSENFLT